MLRIEKVTRRWILRSFLIIVAVLAAVVTLLVVLTRNSYYTSAQQLVRARAGLLQNTLIPYAGDHDVDFSEQARTLVENFSDRNRMELLALDRNRRVVISSGGFMPQKLGSMPDLQLALKSDSRMGESEQRLNSGEHVYCVSIASPVQAGDILALRLMISLEAVDRQIRRTAVLYSLIGVGIAFFVLLTNLIFLHSITRPVAEVSRSARQIAAGDFDVRIDNHYKDEMGELCDVVNYMADELAQSENMKNEFISSVSHELRTPLTAIRGWGETLADEEHCDPQLRQKGLGVIIGETERLSSIVEDLLDFSKMQSGHFSIQKEKMDILAELEEAILAFSQRAQREGICLTYNEPQMLSPIEGDKNRIRQVFVNVLDNALKYSERGGEVRVEAAEEYGMITVSVTDHGCGIRPEDLPRIKMRFYKGNSSRRGSGIGLAVVDEIVTRLGGSFEIESRLGVGTTVTLSFPVYKESE